MQTTQKNIRQYVFYGMHTIVPLLLGLTIYLLLSQGSGILFFPERVREFQATVPQVFPASVSGILRSYLPDMLWAYALTVSVSGVLGYSDAKCLHLFCICSGFGGLMEFLQRWAVFPGTFDPLDIALEAAAVLAALFLIRSKESQNPQNPQNPKEDQENHV